MWPQVRYDVRGKRGMSFAISGRHKKASSRQIADPLPAPDEQKVSFNQPYPCVILGPD